jgi:hypothetical protein
MSKPNEFPGKDGFMVTEFHNDDRGYLTWVRQNPEGFLVNCNASPTPNYVIAHRATCHMISGVPANGTTFTVLYKKICGNTLTELDAWAKREVNIRPHRCGICEP